jgi:hypothetical protein
MLFVDFGSSGEFLLAYIESTRKLFTLTLSHSENDFLLNWINAEIISAYAQHKHLKNKICISLLENRVICRKVMQYIVA